MPWILYDKMCWKDPDFTSLKIQEFPNILSMHSLSLFFPSERVNQQLECLDFPTVIFVISPGLLHLSKGTPLSSCSPRSLGIYAYCTSGFCLACQVGKLAFTRSYEIVSNSLLAAKIEGSRIR